MLRRTFFLVFAMPLLTGCLSGSDDGDHEAPGFDFPSEDTGAPVPAVESGTPTGRWHAKAHVEGVAIWAVSLADAPPTAQWFARWTPATSGGIVLVSDIIVEQIRGDNVYVSHDETVARVDPSPFDVQGLIDVGQSATAGPRLLVLTVQTFDAAGEFEAVIEWDETEARPWAPTVLTSQSATIERLNLGADGTLEVTRDMAGFHGVHAILPCVYDERVAYEELFVQLGDTEPDRWSERGIHDDAEYTEWTSYAGFSTYNPDTVPLTVEYEGPTPPEVHLVRSRVDVAALLEEELGLNVWIGGASAECVRATEG